MKNPSALFDQIAEGIDASMLLTMALPLAFPVVAYFDNAQSAYLEWSICAAMLATLMALSSFFSGFETRRVQQIADTRLLHSYLLNGGRA
jgi:hypothetical protein